MLRDITETMQERYQEVEKHKRQLQQAQDRGKLYGCLFWLILGIIILVIIL